jgi:hypothetical protein
MKRTTRLLAATALACALGTAHAANDVLEEAFWACDYIATTRGTASAPQETCAVVYEEFKATRFGGDFEELVAWWQVNKVGAHARMERFVAAAPVAAPASAPVASIPDRPSRAARVMAATRAYFAELGAALRND